jgi:Tat protein translocase TatB subunit
VDSIFGIGGPELLLILVLATIILGPLNMIKLARQLGILLRDLRNYYNSLTANLSEELSELSELQETIKREVNSAIPKSEELQVTMPDFEAQPALDTPAPTQLETGAASAVASQPAQLEAGASAPVFQSSSTSSQPMSDQSEAAPSPDTSSRAQQA